jgi:hypothetical protein
MAGIIGVMTASDVNGPSTGSRTSARTRRHLWLTYRLTSTAHSSALAPRKTSGTSCGNESTGRAAAQEPEGTRSA